MKSIIDYTNLLKSFFAQKQALADEVATRSYLGAKNLLQIKARESNSGRGTWTGNSFVGQNAPNLTFTVNDDETITVNGYTGSSDEFIVLNLYVENGVQKNTDYAIGKSCILTGCPSGGSASSYFMRFFRYDGSNSAVDVGNGVNLTPTAVNSGWKNITVNVAANTTVNNITFKPMIRLASDTDPTYQPYAMTNRELTEGKANKSDLASINITGTTNNTGATISADKYFYLNGQLVKAKTAIANGATFTANTNYVSANVGTDLAALNSRPIFACGSKKYTVAAETTQLVDVTTDLGITIPTGYELFGAFINIAGANLYPHFSCRPSGVTTLSFRSDIALTDNLLYFTVVMVKA